MLVPLEKILLGLGAAAVILLGILITSNVVNELCNIQYCIFVDPYTSNGKNMGTFVPLN